jgi:hypothetical protein
MPRIDVNYANTLIYKLVCNDLEVKDIYVGNTTNFVKRQHSHKKDCNNPNSPSYQNKKYQIIRANGGWSNWTMVLIEKYPCSNGMEARARERYWFEQLNANLNMICPIISTQEVIEQRKQYYENNKQKLLEQYKEYYESNKEKKKQYYENNKAEIVENKKEYQKKIKIK